jgi:hypothetical protein
MIETLLWIALIWAAILGVIAPTTDNKSKQ